MRSKNGDSIPVREAYLFLKFDGGFVQLILDLRSRDFGDARILNVTSPGGNPSWEWRREET